MTNKQSSHREMFADSLTKVLGQVPERYPGYQDELTKFVLDILSQERDNERQTTNIQVIVSKLVEELGTKLHKNQTTG
jgi:hypothetical protein